MFQVDSDDIVQNRDPRGANLKRDYFFGGNLFTDNDQDVFNRYAG